MRELVHFGGRERDTFARRDEGEQRGQVLNVMPETRREAGGLATGANGGVVINSFSGSARATYVAKEFKVPAVLTAVSSASSMAMWVIAGGGAGHASADHLFD